MPVVTAQAPLPQSFSLAKEVQAPPIAAPTPAEVIEEKKEESLRPGFAALAREQKEARRREMAFKAREEALKVKEASYEKDYIPRSKLSANPLAVLTEAGYDFNQIAEMLLKTTEPSNPAVSRMEQEIEKLRADQETRWKAEEDKREQAIQNELSNIRTEAKLLIDSDPEYDTIKEENASEAIVLLIKEVYDKSGKRLSVEQAAKQVEDHLVEEAMKKANLRKVRAKLFPENADTKQGLKTQQTPPAKIQSQTPQTQQIKTLTNAATATPSRSMSQRERRERAMMAFMGQLEG